VHIAVLVRAAVTRHSTQVLIIVRQWNSKAASSKPPKKTLYGTLQFTAMAVFPGGVCDGAAAAETTRPTRGRQRFSGLTVACTSPDTAKNVQVRAYPSASCVQQASM
jgi:hypothetical protein